MRASQTVVFILLTVVLAALITGAVLAHAARGPYSTYWGPTPLGWWLTGLVLAALLAAAAIMLALRPWLLPTGLLLVLLGVTAVALLWGFLAPASRLEWVILAGVLALAVPPFVALVRSKGELRFGAGRGIFLGVACVAVLLAAGPLALASFAIVSTRVSTTDRGSSPDGRYELVYVQVGEGAWGRDYAYGDVRQDFHGLLRHEWMVFYETDKYAGPGRWADARTVLVSGHPLSIFATPPAGWD